LWINKPFFKYAIGTFIVVITLYYLGKIDYMIEPVQQFIATLFFPLILSGMFYYLFRPIIQFFSRVMPKTFSVVLLFVVITLGLFSLFYFGGGKISGQFSNLTEDSQKTCFRLINLVLWRMWTLKKKLFNILVHFLRIREKPLPNC
jgi:predicted PurR-regulated permease PerM